MDIRRHVGDWEGDTIVGKGVMRIVTLVERKTGFVRLRRVANGEAEPTMRVILHALSPLRGNESRWQKYCGRSNLNEPPAKTTTMDTKYIPAY